LAVIAWRHPVLQSEVIKIRTNKAYDHIKHLEELGFLTKKKKGRTCEIKLSEKFFRYFDLPDEKDIKEVFKKTEQQHATQEELKIQEEKKKLEEKEKHRDMVGNLEVYDEPETRPKSSVLGLPTYSAEARIEEEKQHASMEAKQASNLQDPAGEPESDAEMQEPDDPFKEKPLEDGDSMETSESENAEEPSENESYDASTLGELPRDLETPSDNLSEQEITPEKRPDTSEDEETEELSEEETGQPEPSLPDDEAKPGANEPDDDFDEQERKK